MRVVLLTLTFLPFLHYGIRDNAFHFRGRKVSYREHFLHLGIGVCQAIILIQAIRGALIPMFAGLALFVIAGGIDEYVFHRGLPEEESDLHAKQHLALLIFVVVAVITLYLEDHRWRIPPLLP